MIDTAWLSDRLCDCLRWQLAHPGRDDGPEVPWAGLRVWSLFLQFNAARGGGFGPAPISYEAMEAYQAVTGERLRPFEIEIIRALDRAWMTAVDGRANSGNASTASDRPMSPALFDAVFAG